MPEGVALETTKRKFYKALDTLTTSSQVSLAPSETKAAPSAKRPATATAAFDEARERAAKRLRHSISSSSLPHVIQASTPPKKAETESRVVPNFSPWSQERFLLRMRTFSRVSLWHPKPEPISEVQWAKRGWACVGVNTVACKGGCESRIVVSVDSQKRARPDGQDETGLDSEDDGDDNDDDDDSAVERLLAERYQNAIIEGHAPSCLWRKAGCKDDIHHIQVVRPSVWQPELRKRYHSSLAISAGIEKVKMKTIEHDRAKMLVPGTLLTGLPPDILRDQVSTRTDSAASTNALQVALHGWTGSTDAGSQLLNCEACFQRIGLWMYQPGYRPAGLLSDDEDSEDAATIDLVEMHRDHCPWRNSATQKAAGDLKGLNACEILQRVVSAYARDQRREPNGQTVVQEGDAVAASRGASVLTEVEATILSKEEVAQQDKERESRLRRIKALFTIKRRSKTVSIPMVK